MMVSSRRRAVIRSGKLELAALLALVVASAFVLTTATRAAADFRSGSAAVPADGTASGSAPMRPRLLCNSFYVANESVKSDDDVATLVIPKEKPRRCTIWREGWKHYQSLTFKNATWRGWGTSRATARATVTHMGSRQRVKVLLYRTYPDCNGDPIYTRVRINISKHVWRTDTCPLTRPTVVSLTFNYGWASQYHARGMLSSHGMRGTFYISTGDVDGRQPCCMRWSQIARLAADQNEIGGHTIHHVNLKGLNLAYAQKVKEICDDRQRLIAKGFDPVSFAYPLAAFDQTAEGIVQSCGYQSARTGGSVSTGGLYAESIPPRDPFATRAVTSPRPEIRLSSLTSVVTAAATHGGGWLQFQFHEICSRSRPNYRRCMSTWGPVRETTLNAFLDWLRDRAPSGTVVQTVRQAMSGGSRARRPHSGMPRSPAASSLAPRRHPRAGP
jgi:peptidoglycan/xylan/chitin deacetylase (PgdA/CDA1 family)